MKFGKTFPADAVIQLG